MKLSYSCGVWSFKCAYTEREIPKAAHFKFTKANGWHTTSLAAAVRLREYAVGDARRKLNRLILSKTPWPYPLPPPPAGLKLKPYQAQAVKFALERSSSYLRADPGLGKTIMAATIARAIEAQHPGHQFIYICPPSLTRNVEAEFQKWAPNLTTGIYGDHIDPHGCDVIIIPDTQLTPTLRGQIFIVGNNVVAFVDEAHRYKGKSQRTEALWGSDELTGFLEYTVKRVFLSGTPMPNRPTELYPLLTNEAPELIDFRNEYGYGIHYCAGQQSGYRGAWEFTGASNVEELKQRIMHPTGPFMLKLEKKLLKLPPVTTEIFTLTPPKKTRRQLEAIEKKLPTDVQHSPDAALRQLLKEENGKSGDLHLSTYLRLLGALKIDSTVGLVQDILDGTEDSVLVFARHKEVLRELAKRFSATDMVIDGATPPKKRQAIVDTFQKIKEVRLCFLNYEAGGVGFNLQKANRVLHVEPPWVPATARQATDRAHRMGQKQPVHEQFLVFPNSLDSRVIGVQVKKRNVTDHF